MASTAWPPQRVQAPNRRKAAPSPSPLGGLFLKQFSVRRFRANCEALRLKPAGDVAVYGTAVLEYMSAELLELGGNRAADLDAVRPGPLPPALPSPLPPWPFRSLAVRVGEDPEANRAPPHRLPTD